MSESQSRPRYETGEFVNIQFPDGHWHNGRVVEVSNTAVHVNAGGKLVWVAHDDKKMKRIIS